MKDNIHNIIFKKEKLLPTNDYSYTRLNLLKNNSVMLDDQTPHYDYLPM